MASPCKLASIGVLTDNVIQFLNALNSYDVVYVDTKYARSAASSNSSFMRQQVVDMLNSFDILLADPDIIGPVIHDLKVSWMQVTWAGVDSFMPFADGRNPPSTTLTRSAGIFGTPMSEYIISNIINYERNAAHLIDAQRKSLWDASTVNHRCLPELSICILGVGCIGSEVARRLKSLGMSVYGMSTKIPEIQAPYIDEYFLKDSLPAYLSKSDYVCSILPKTPETNGLLDNDVLAHCAGRKSVFINIGRGNVIKDESILKAIRNSWIRGAILDVFEKEPLPVSSPLWQLHGVIITPHVSGPSLPRYVASCFMENLKLYEQGQPMKYVVDWKKGY